MFAKKAGDLGLLALLVSSLLSVYNCTAAQDVSKPLDPHKARITYSFPIEPGGKPLRFEVELGKASRTSGVSVFRERDSSPFQNLPACKGDLTDEFTGYDKSLDFLKHADLNFDGFEDLELLQHYIPHLDKKLYCIYLWDSKAGRFSYSPDLTQLAVNIEAHPESKTITTHEDWQGGAWQESTYRWNGGKLELIEQNGLFGDWSLQTDAKCGFTFSCSRLVKGAMLTTLEKPVCTADEMDHLPDCPTAAAPPAPTAPKSAPAKTKRD
jgi:hypothetical protein